MKSAKLEEMNVAQLVEQFVGIALAQDVAARRDETRKYNRLYDELEAVEGDSKHERAINGALCCRYSIIQTLRSGSSQRLRSS